MKQQLRNERQAQAAAAAGDRGASQEVEGGKNRNVARSAPGNNRSDPPTKSNPKSQQPTQVGAVATSGRAYGAPRRRGNFGPEFITRSIAYGNDAPPLSDEEIAEMHPKEAMAMNVQTVEEHEQQKGRERRRQQKLQEEMSQFKRNATSKPAPSKDHGVMAAIPNIDDGDDGNPSQNDTVEEDKDSSSRKWILFGVFMLLVAIASASFCAVYFSIMSTRRGD